MLPGDDVTVYVAGAPPVAGATTVTVASPSPTTTVGVPGTPGAATTGVAGLDAVELDDVPAALAAVAVNV